MNDSVNEYTPLLPAGFHDISFDELDNLLVIPFENNGRRPMLMERFSEIGINAEIWLDGSFSTQKEEPGDIDVLFIVNSNKINTLIYEKRDILALLFNREVCKIKYYTKFLYIFQVY